MATVVYADLNTIQDEDILRRMWANTEDFGRKKEIRARMYKLREQRLKDFYTTGDVSDMNRKHQQLPRHAESLEDQGFMTMKSKEIRDSESPTRDMSRRKGNGYWDSRQETVYGRGKEEDANIEVKYVSTEGRGVVKEADMEKKVAYQTESAQESTWKQDNNSFMKAETQKEMSQSASVAKSDNTEERTFAQNEEFSNFKTMTEQNESMSSVSNVSASTSSRQVTSSSYRTTSDNNQDGKVVVIEDFGTNARPLVELTSDSMRDFIDDDVQTESCTNQHKRETTSKTSTTNQSLKQVFSTQTLDDSVQLDLTNFRVRGEDVDVGENVKVTEYRTITDNQSRKEDQTNEQLYRNYEVEKSQDRSLEQTVDISTLRDSSKKEEDRSARSDDFLTAEQIQRKTSRTGSSTRHETIVNEKAATEQKILNEIQKLDSYLSTHTPAPSTPASPPCEPDGGWTLVSDKGGEFVYHERSEPDGKKSAVPSHAAGKKTTPPSSMDLPTSATDGQYMTTYQQSYNKISVDHTPSHEFFVKTLRSSPERSTPSPTKRDYTSSSSRSSPERRKLSNSKSSLEKNTPDHRRRADTKSPEYYEKKQRSSPSKSPVQKKKQTTHHNESATSARKHSETRITTKETKSKRKFSSTKERAANRNRVATPGASPSTSPVHKKTGKETSDSDSDASQATYDCTKKSEVITESRTNMTTIRKKDKKEQSPEFSSEGSITRELKKKKQTTPEPSAFAPIKQFKTTPQDLTRTDKDQLKHIKSNKLTVENVRKHKENDYLPTGRTENFVNEERDETKLVRHENKNVRTTKGTVNTVHDICEMKDNVLRQRDVQRDIAKDDTDTKTVEELTFEKQATSKTSGVVTAPSETLDNEEKREISIESTNLKSPEKKESDDFDPSVAKMYKAPFARPEDQNPEKSFVRQPSATTPERHQPGTDRLHHERSPDRKQPGTDHQHPERSPDHKHLSTDHQHPERSPERPHPGTGRQLPEKSPERQQPDTDNQHPERSPDHKHLSTDRQHPEKSPERHHPGTDRQLPEKSPERQQPDTDHQHPERSPDHKHLSTDRQHPERSPERHHPGTDRPHSETSPERHHPGTDRQHHERSPERHHPGTDRQHPERSSDRKQPGTDQQHSEKSPDRKYPSTDRQHPERSPDRKHPSTDRQYPERSQSPVKKSVQETSLKKMKTSDEKTERRDSSNRSTKTKETTTLARQDNFSVTRRNTQKPICNDSKPRNTSNVPLVKKPIVASKHFTPERKSTLSKHTTKVVTSSRLEQNTSPDSPTRRHPVSPTVQRKTAQSRQLIQARKVPTSSHRPQTTQPTTTKTTNASPSTLSKTTSTSIQETTKILLGRKREDTTTKKRPSFEGGKTESPKPKVSIPRSVPQKSKLVDTSSRPAQKPQTETFNKPQRRVVPSQVKLQSKDTGKTAILTTRETHRTETQNFLKNEAKSVSDLEDETPPEEFYGDLDDEFDSSIQKSMSTSATQVKVRNDVYYNAKKDQTHELDSRNSSVLSMEEDSPTKPKSQPYKKEPSLKTKVNQDLLNVVVQHPKSSRESSPGYSSTADNFAVTTSDDGESNPRYADFVSEPEDVEVFDKLTGPSGPIPYSHRINDDVGDENDVPKSVAEKVSVFLNEAKKSLETKVTGNQVLIDNSNSVSKAKTLFEKVTKTENDEKKHHLIEDFVDRPGKKTKTDSSYYETHKITEHVDDTAEGEFDLAVNSLPLKTSNETDYRQELKETTKSSRKDTPVPKPLGKTFLRNENRKFIEKESIGAKTDVSTKKSFFENKAEEQKHPRKPKQEPSSYAKDTQASTVRSRSPDKVHSNEQRRKSSVTTEDVSAMERRQFKSEVTVKTITKLHEPTSSFDRNDSDKSISSRRSSKPGERTPCLPKYQESTKQPERRGSSPTKGYDTEKTIGSPKVTMHYETTEKYESHTTTQNVNDTPRKTGPHAAFPTKSYETSRKTDHTTYSHSGAYDSPRSAEPHALSPQSYVTSRTIGHTYPHSGEVDSPRNAEPTASSPKSYEMSRETEYTTSTHSTPYNSPRNTEPHTSTLKSYDSARTTTTHSRKFDSNRKTEPRAPSPSKSYDRPWKSEPRATSPPKSYESPRKSEPRSSSPPKSYDRPWKSEPRASSPPKSYDSPRKSEPRSSSPPKSYNKPWKSEPRATSPPKSYDSPRKSEPRSSSPPKSYDKPWKSEPRATSPPKSYDSPRKSEPRASSPPKPYDSPRKSEPRASSPSKLGTKSYESSLKSENVGEQTVRSYVKTSDSVLQRTSKPENDVKTLSKSLNDSTIFKQNETVLQKTKTEEKFGVQLRKTPSANKFDTITVRLKSSTSEAPAIENIYDLELLEQMLIKAEAYEERRRIRAQIRLVKKELEEQHNSITRSTSVQTRTHEVKSHTSSSRDEHTSRRSVKEPSPEPKMSLTKPSYNTRVQNKEEDKEKTVPKRSYSERPKSTHSPDHTSVKTVTTTTTIREKSDSFSRLSPEERTVCTYEVKSQPVDSSFLFQKSTEPPQPEKSSNLKKTSYEQRKTTTTSTTTTNTVTDPITSSYGMGPIDEHGKPLFGLRALRRTHQDQTPANDDLARTETVTYNTYTLTTSDFDEPANLASLKTMSKVDREFSGPEIVEVSNDDSAYSEDTRRTSKEYTVEENLENSQTETGHEEETRRPLVRGDSVKALQHKYQQATEAANQTCGGSSYPKAGLILRSNSLQHSDDPNQSSSSMRKTKTETVETTRRVLHSSYGGGGGDKQVVVKAQMSEQVEDSSGLKSARQVQGVKAMTTTMTKDGPVEKSSSAVRVTTSGGGTSSTTTTTSFLDNNAKVTGVQDILSRMRNADLVTETDDTEEDAKARALLNKFLGASVILQGMEQGMRHSASQQKSAALVGEVDKQLVKATTRTREENIEEICDKDQLKFLLDSCSDLEDKRKLRARLREVMAEDKGGVGEAKGTLSDVPGPVEITGIWPSNKSSNVDDSGTESGEDLRMINPEIMQEVQTALSRLEGVIPVLDPTKRNAVTQLVSSLQCCLKINKDQQLAPPTPPTRKFGNKRSLKNRHTVGVTREELVEARMWADECGLNRTMTADDINTGTSSFLENVFRPVRFVPPPVVEEKIPISRYTKLPLLKVAYQKPILYKIGFFMEPAPQNGSMSYFEPDPKLSYERSLSDTGSLCDYDPSLGLFTPKQTVQIAVHKAAINKQISCRESTKVQGRGSSEDGDVSSADEDKHELSSVHRLLQLASESNNKPKFTGKKQKMKRANTIDIPKRSTIFDYSSDDHGASADEQNRKGSDDMGHLGKKERPPSFEPKTENDHKFLSFLQRVSESEGSKMPAYNPSARGGKHWRNRFSTIKTTFESKDITPPKNTFSPSPAKLFWQKSENQSLNEIKTNSSPGKLPWSVKTQEDGVIVGSLTVAKPSIVNNFNHAPKSAFKPIEKKPTTPLISPASGTVKQIAAMKFSTFETPILQKPKPLNMKTYANNTEKDKSKFLAGNNNTSNVTHKFYNIPSNVVSQEVKQKVQEKHFVNNQINNQLAKPKYKKLDPAENTSYVEKNYFYRGQPKKSTGQKEMLKSQSPFLSQVGKQNYPTSPTKSSGQAPFANSINSPTLARLPRSVLSEPKRREIIPQFMEDFEKSYQSDGPNRYCEYASRPKEPRNKLPNTFYNGEESNVKPHHLSYPNKPDVKVEEENVNKNKNSRQSLICEEKDSLKFMGNANFSNDFSHPVTETAPKPNGYSNFTKTESNSPMNNTTFVREDKLQDNRSYLCNLRDASTIDTDREYVSNIPVTSTILKNGQYISITPKSRTPTMDGDGANEFIKQSPNTSGGRSPINRTSPPSSDGSSNNGGRVYYNNTQMRLSNKIEDMSQMENYVNARLASNSALTPHNLPAGTPDRVSPLRNWAPAGSPSIKVEKASDPVNGGDCYEEKAVSRVMGQAQCQVAVSVNNRNRTRYDDSKNIQSELRLQVQQSARQKSLSPTNFPNVLQKSESWHQMVKEKMNLAKQAPPLPKISKAKSSHSLALPRQFESAISPETVENKKMTVSQYLSKQSNNREQRRYAHKASKSMLDIDDLENVDEVFESIFQEASKKKKH
ncbi:uncharacterized protein LOC106674087 isoform X3 [Cimex lectularius]|uniref:Smoothelin domain-containing protein n=1 Tax=Cimex lectularius TaxID=79782 RepID=A0A8I6SEU7_CIMLE|nr:uncharacterized protein LOC106674087 isoform X3 [Cimex lectularius]